MMGSANFLTIKNQLSDLKITADRDTLSEASESGTSNSVTSAEDLQKLAVILGLNSAEDVYQERFRVDRRRLETMLADNLEDSQKAQAFFNRIMSETNTLINWPARLKIGARSKKDPHVRVSGRPDDVKLAREKIMQLLDTRSNRVTMKIDVSYTDHSHIIGKGGLTIKRVMEETGCHIHFPDSNRTSTMEKSNQVSIAGDMERVERARARVRALTPLIFCFELPIVPASSPLPDLDSPYVQKIQHQYNVQVMMRNRPKLHANLMVVKGVQWEVQATMEATTLLMKYMCGPLMKQTKVQMNMEISPMHHQVVIGKGAEQLKTIMKGTNTQIMFPDAEDPNIPAIKKSCVTITGHIQDVYSARQQLVGSLPVVVIFDVPNDMFHKEDDEIMQLMQKHNVFISLRRKPKQGIASLVIKGIERCAGDMYEARRELLGGPEPKITAEVPESYNIPAITSAALTFGVFNPFSPTQNMTNVPSPCNYNVQLDLPTTYANMGNSSMYGQQPPTPGGYPSPMSPPVFANAWVLPSPQPRPSPFMYPSVPPSYTQHQPSWHPMSSGAEMQEMQPPVMMQPMQPSYQMPQITVDGRPTTLNQLFNSSSQASSGYQSNFTGSSVSLDTQNISGGESSNMVSPSVSPISKSPTPSTSMQDNDRSQAVELATIINDLSPTERRAVGCEKKTLETLNKMSPLTHYKKMKTEAEKAMSEAVGSGYRVPTTKWSGYYFSRTSPSTINLRECKSAETSPEKAWNRSELVRPNIVESVATPPRVSFMNSACNKPCRYQQLYDLLQDKGLAKYIDLFKQHEVDLSTFASLSEADLCELGVTAFGARRKMLLIIADLKKQVNAYKGSVAPGAERNMITSPPYNTAALQDSW